MVIRFQALAAMGQSYRRAPSRLVFSDLQLMREPSHVSRKVCAGVGGISLGAHAAGGTSLAFVERCDIACQALVRNHGKVIQGDLTQRLVRLQLHSVAPSTACVIAAGTPCQGFSVQGFGRGLQDSRSLTLLSVLQTTWLHQAYGLVLECVTEIVKHEDAMAAIFFLASRMDFQVKQVHLELGAQCASNRLRRWCALAAVSR